MSVFNFQKSIGLSEFYKKEVLNNISKEEGVKL